jgi:hypothetical protein
LQVHPDLAKAGLANGWNYYRNYQRIPIGEPKNYFFKILLKIIKNSIEIFYSDKILIEEVEK